MILNHTAPETNFTEEDGFEKVRSFSRGSYESALRYINIMTFNIILRGVLECSLFKLKCLSYRRSLRQRTHSQMSNNIPDAISGKFEIHSDQFEIEEEETNNTVWNGIQLNTVFLLSIFT